MKKIHPDNCVGVLLIGGRCQLLVPTAVPPKNGVVTLLVMVLMYL